MTITRHFIDVTNPDGSRRRVHYRRAGMGPPVVLIHQSPRSGAEYEGLIKRWAADFIFSAEIPCFKATSLSAPSGDCGEVRQFPAAN